MRMMGIDYGDVRIGIAVSDELGITARGLEAVKNGYGLFEKAVDRVSLIAREFEINTIVIGFPVNMNGTQGERCEKVIRFEAALQDKLKKDISQKVLSREINIVRWDERLSTSAAHKIMRETGKKPSLNKPSIDMLSAEYILRGYMDSMTNKNYNLADFLQNKDK